MIPKYRVWDKENQKYVTNVSVQFSNGVGFWWRIAGGMWRDDTVADIEMWSTLLDKKKVEIYDGDKLRFWWHIDCSAEIYTKTDTTEFEGVVYYNTEAAAFFVKSDDFDYELNACKDDCEVIGNIHETPVIDKEK